MSFHVGYCLYQREVYELDSMDNTMKFRAIVEEQEVTGRDIFIQVYNTLVDKGYDPINQIVGYLLSGDPAYIPRHNNARNLIRKKERHDLIEELVRAYVGSEQQCTKDY